MQDFICFSKKFYPVDMDFNWMASLVKHLTTAETDKVAKGIWVYQ